MGGIDSELRIQVSLPNFAKTNHGEVDHQLELRLKLAKPPLQFPLGCCLLVCIEKAFALRCWFCATQHRAATSGHRRSEHIPSRPEAIAGQKAMLHSGTRQDL